MAFSLEPIKKNIPQIMGCMKENFKTGTGSKNFRNFVITSWISPLTTDNIPMVIHSADSLIVKSF